MPYLSPALNVMTTAARKAGRDAEAEAMLPELFLSVNAIASGLRTTG